MKVFFSIDYRQILNGFLTLDVYLFIHLFVFEGAILDSSTEIKKKNYPLIDELILRIFNPSASGFSKRKFLLM